MRYLIVGAGAVGGYLAALLQESGHRVTLLVRPERARILARDGLVLAEPDGPTSAFPMETVTADTVRPEYDVVLLSVKAYALPGAIADLRGAIGPDTVVIPSLNGIAHIEALDAAFPGQVLGGVCLTATELRDDGAIRILRPGATLGFGELDGQDTERVRRIADDLSDSPIESSASTTIVADMWEKWLLLASGGATNTLLGADVGRIVAADGGARTAEAVVDEVVDVMTRAGHAPRTDAVQRARGVLTEAGSHFTTSMYRDHRAGRPVEVEAVLGDLVRRADRLDTPAPLLAAAAAALRIAPES